MIPGLITDLVTHLNTEAASFVTIEPAFAMEPIEDLSAAIPALYVYDGADGADPDVGDTTCYRQSVTLRVVTFIVCETADLGALRFELWEAMAGYQPDALCESMAYAGGDVVKITGQYVWWRGTYQTRRVFRKGG